VLGTIDAFLKRHFVERVVIEIKESTTLFESLESYHPYNEV
jgi:hypothetical protein